MLVHSFLDLSISVAAFLDTFVVICCAILLFRYARLTAVHPGFVYLAYHLMFVTFRLYSVWAGSPTLFSHWRGALRVTEGEIAWAGVLSDLALLSMTAAFVLCSRRDQRRRANRVVSEWNSRLLSERVILAVVAITFPIGIIAILAFGYLPSGGRLNIDVGQWSTSSWIVVTQNWPILALLALIYYYGFRRIFIVPTFLLLVLMSIQGYDRFRVILSVIFLLVTWQTRTGYRWPKKWLLASLLCLGLISFPMKKIGLMIQGGERLSDIIDFGKTEFRRRVWGGFRRSDVPRYVRLSHVASRQEWVSFLRNHVLSVTRNADPTSDMARQASPKLVLERDQQPGSPDA